MNIIILIVLTLIIISIIILYRTPIKFKKNLLLMISITLIALISYSKITRGFIPIPIIIRYLMHQIFPPNYYEDALILDRFNLYEKDNCQTYKIEPKYLDLYQLVIIDNVNGIPKEIHKVPQLKLKLDFISGEKVIETRIVTTFGDMALFFGKDMKRYSQITLSKFSLPFKNKYLKELSIRLEVIEPDRRLKNIKDTIKIAIIHIGFPP